jgi:O-antigen/teichoic acid export membrane protein
MMKPRSLLRNTSYVLLAQLLVRTVNFVQLPLLVRHLGKAEYGVYSLTLAFPAMFLVLSDMGINSIMLRKVARDRGSCAAVLPTVLFLKVVLTAVFITVLSVTVALSNYGSFVKALLIVSALGSAASIYIELVIAAARGAENFALEAYVSAGRAVSFLLVVIAVVAMNGGLMAVVGGWVVTSLLASLFCLGWCKRHYGLRVQWVSAKEAYRMLRESWPFALHNMISPLFGTIDVLMLSLLSTYESVGTYNAAYRLVIFLHVVPEALNRVLFARLSRLFTTTPGDFTAQINRALLHMLILGLPASVGLMIVSDKVVVTLFSSEYANSGMILRILAAPLAFYFVRVIFSAALYASNRERLALTCFGCATALNALLDLVLIPRYDYMGSAYASLCAEVMLCTAYWVAVKRFCRVSLDGAGVRLMCAVGLLAGTAMFLMGRPLVVQVTISAVVYGLGVYFFKVLNPEEVCRISGFVRKLWARGRVIFATRTRS